MVRSLLVATLACTIAVNASAHAIKKGTSRAAPAPSTPSVPDTTGAPAGDSVVVTGFVLDSLRELPLAGATVLITNTTFTATTDPSGRFRIVAHGLPDGLYQVGFFHPTLDSLGISPPTQPVMIGRGKTSFVQLYVPSAQTVVASVCPDSSRTESRGLVMGVVRDASTEKPMPGVRVGHACRVPTQIVVRLQARCGKGASGWIEMSVPPGGLGLRDVLLGERAPVVASAPSAPGTTTPGAPAPGAASSATDSTAHEP